MKLFLERFVLSGLAGLASALIVKAIESRLEHQVKHRKMWFVGIALIACIAAFYVADVAEGHGVGAMLREINSIVVGKSSSPSPTPPESKGHSEGEISNSSDFIQRYIVKPTAKPSSRPGWAILIGGHDKQTFPELDSAAIVALFERKYDTVSIFRPSVVQEGKHEDLYMADPSLVSGLKDYCDGLIVGKVTSTEHKDDTQEGLFTVEMSIEARIIDTHSSRVGKELRISENGAGFSPSEARTNAEHRLSKDLKTSLVTALR